MSYSSGLSFNNNLFGKKSSSTFNQFRKQFDAFNNNNNNHGNLPFILLPEWPLPIEILHPYISTLALVTDLHQFPYPSTSSIEFEMNSNNNNNIKGGNTIWNTINNNNNNINNVDGNGEYYFGDSVKSITRLLVS